MNRLDVLVTYDVNTEFATGQARLRRVATICKNFGQRVQLSVFECHITEPQLEDMEAKLLKVIDKEKDSLRIYLLRGGRDGCLRKHGRDRFVDFDAPLILCVARTWSTLGIA